MGIYLAVVKLPGQTAVKVNYIADDNVQAYNSMLKAMHCTSSEEIEEFDLMEVIDGPGYRMVAAKAKAGMAASRQPPLALPAPKPAEEQIERAIPFPTYKNA